MRHAPTTDHAATPSTGSRVGISASAARACMDACDPNMCTVPGSHPFSCLLAWDGWDSASACVCLRLFVWLSPHHLARFSRRRPRRTPQRCKLTRAVSADGARRSASTRVSTRHALVSRKRLPAYHHVNQHAVIVKPMARLKVLCRCARKRAAWPPDCHHGGQRLRGVHAQLGRRAACPRAERVRDRRSRPADLVAAARGRAAEPCSALRRAVTHWQAAASRELVRRALPPADGLGATAAAIAVRIGRIRFAVDGRRRAVAAQPVARVVRPSPRRVRAPRDRGPWRWPTEAVGSGQPWRGA